MEKVFEARAEALAKIFKYDKENYGDINFATILAACKLAGIKVPAQKE